MAKFKNILMDESAFRLISFVVHTQFFTFIQFNDIIYVLPVTIASYNMGTCEQMYSKNNVFKPLWHDSLRVSRNNWHN